MLSGSCGTYALVGLAIGFALPTFAQQSVHPKIAQQIRAMEMKYDEAFNTDDHPAINSILSRPEHETLASFETRGCFGGLVYWCFFRS